jgi:hypothetical protein
MQNDRAFERIHCSVYDQSDEKLIKVGLSQALVNFASKCGKLSSRQAAIRN